MLRPYVALGGANYTIALSKTFDHHAQISRADSNGAYYMLRQVAVRGNNSGYGAMATMGVEVLSFLALDLDLFVRWLVVPPARFTFSVPSTPGTPPWEESRTLYPGQAVFGARAMIPF